VSAGPVEVRRLTEDDWADLRAVRLAMLLDTPFAYGSTYARERAYPEATWRQRAGGLAWLAWQGGLPVGSVTLWADPQQPPEEIYLVGMWVASHARGEGVADALVEAAVGGGGARGPGRVGGHGGAGPRLPLSAVEGSCSRWPRTTPVAEGRTAGSASSRPARAAPPRRTRASSSTRWCATCRDDPGP
jgi:GNAT superfamily N-acetyltransferase